MSSPTARRVLSWLAIWLVLATCLALTAGSAIAEDSSQSSGASIYWGANVKGWPDSTAALDAFEGDAGKPMSIVHWGQPWAYRGVTGRFQTSYMQAARDRGSIPLLDWGSWNDTGQADELSQPDYRLADIAAGSRDDYIAAWAQAARDWGHPFFLRFDHEMNGSWSSWGEQANGASPGDFVAAWRHVVDVFRQQGATNVTWVWCPNVSSRMTTDVEGLYPGDDYVDWTCLDGYNWSALHGTPWLPFAQVFRGSSSNGNRDSYQAVLNLAPNKPMMIGETASTERGGSKADWIATALAQLPTDFPQVRAFVWFNGDGNVSTTDWRIETSPAAQAAFAAGIQSPVYAANNFGTLDGSPIQPLAAVALGGDTRIMALADAFTTSASPNTNYGKSTRLQVGGSNQVVTYLLFDLSSLAGATLKDATLRFKTAPEAGSGARGTARVMLVPDARWKEQYITYTNTTPVSTTQLGAISGTSNNQWYDVQIDARAVQPKVGQALSVAIVLSDPKDALIIMSRDSADKPAMHFTYATPGQAAPAPVVVPPVVVPPPVVVVPGPDPRYFEATHFRVDDDAIWGYFGARGGVDVFGYPVSRTFTLLGCRSQIFQRQVAQVCTDGQPRLLNLLDPDLFPYTAVNGSVLPAADDDMKLATPSTSDPAYGTAIVDFVRANVPDEVDGLPVNFDQTFFGLITPGMAATSDPTILGLLNLEVWGSPISPPMRDPSNDNFVYQRFQRGIMHFDATTGLTRGLLLADYLKAVITGQDVPPDLDSQAQDGRLYHQYCPDQPLAVCRPDQLPGSDLRGAFDPQ